MDYSSLRVVKPMTHEEFLGSAWFTKGPALGTTGHRLWQRIPAKLGNIYTPWGFQSPVDGVCLTEPLDGALFVFYLTGKGLAGKGREIIADLHDIARDMGLVRDGRAVLAGCVTSFPRYKYFEKLGFHAVNSDADGVLLEQLDG